MIFQTRHQICLTLDRTATMRSSSIKVVMVVVMLVYADHMAKRERGRDIPLRTRRSLHVCGLETWRTRPNAKALLTRAWLKIKNFQLAVELASRTSHIPFLNLGRTSEGKTMPKLPQRASSSAQRMVTPTENTTIGSCVALTYVSARETTGDSRLLWNERRDNG